MKALLYTITLDEPLLATSLQGDPNSTISLAYLPGSILRGSIIARYAAQHPDRDIDIDETSRRLFFDGSTRYLPAYPLHAEQRTIPTPRCLAHGKYTTASDPGVSIINQYTATPTERQAHEESSGPLRAVKEPFCAQTGNAITLHKPARTLAIHTQRDRLRGRATREQGAIFRYEALEAGQSFQAVVLCDSDADGVLIRDLLNTSTSVRLGRSRSAHYGQATLTLQGEQTDWHELNASAAELAAGSHHTMLLLSDALLCTPQGQVAANIDSAMLAQALGLPLKAVALDAAHSFTSNVLHGGYNTAWRLPLPQQTAIAAGSLISFTLTHGMPAAAVQRLQEQGIGLRRAEGFGRVAFDPPLPDQLTTGQPARPDLATPALTSDEQAFAQQLAGRLARQRTENAVQAFVQGCTFTDLPRRSQLNELRTLVRGHAEQPPTAVFAELRMRLGEMKQTAQQQCERARIAVPNKSPQPFVQWMRTLLDQPDEQTQSLCETLPMVAGQKPLLANRQRLALDLLAAVLEKAARKTGDPDEH